MLQKIYISIAVLLNFLLIKEIWKKKYITVSTNCSAAVFNIYNDKKCFLITKSAY